MSALGQKQTSAQARRVAANVTKPGRRAYLKMRRLMLVHFHHAAALHLHSTAARSAGCSRTDCKDWIFDIDTSGFVEFQRCFDGLALFKRMLEVAEHDVEAGWCKRNGSSRLDFKAALYRAHFHNAAFHRHAVNLALPAGII